jgi:hypothetical protein
LKLFEASKKIHLNPDNVELADVKIEELQEQYQSLQFKARDLQNEMQLVQHKKLNMQSLKQELERDCQTIQQQKWN